MGLDKIQIRVEGGVMENQKASDVYIYIQSQHKC
jgi:hypothetical protein